MMKTIYNKYDKSEMSGLPLASFPGRIITIISENEADKAIDYLLTKSLLGVDTETRPAFRKGLQNKVSLLQVSTDDTCFLFRLNHIGLTPSVIRLLSNTEVPMVGLSWHDDLHALKQRANFNPGHFIDIQNIANNIGIEDKSLQKLYANLFHEKISKRQRLSNWDADVLNDKQKMYAATDAWACLNLYNEIMRLKETGDYQLIRATEPAKQQPNTTSHV